jgi:hypothetical protein
MNRILLTSLGLICAFALSASAGQGKKNHTLTDEQKTLKKEMLEKYDTNKDSKLDRGEKSKMTKEDKKKWSQTFGHKKKSGS